MLEDAIRPQESIFLSWESWTAFEKPTVSPSMRHLHKFNWLTFPQQSRSTSMRQMLVMAPFGVVLWRLNNRKMVIHVNSSRKSRLRRLPLHPKAENSSLNQGTSRHDHHSFYDTADTMARGQSAALVLKSGLAGHQCCRQSPRLGKLHLNDFPSASTPDSCLLSLAAPPSSKMRCQREYHKWPADFPSLVMVRCVW